MVSRKKNRKFGKRRREDGLAACSVVELGRVVEPCSRFSRHRSCMGFVGDGAWANVKSL